MSRIILFMVVMMMNIIIGVFFAILIPLLWIWSTIMKTIHQRIQELVPQEEEKQGVEMKKRFSSNNLVSADAPIPELNEEEEEEEEEIDRNPGELIPDFCLTKKIPPVSITKDLIFHKVSEPYFGLPAPSRTLIPPLK